MEPGDIIIILQQVEHDRFERRGSDLITSQKISLVEALCGFEFVLTHLDGRQLLVKTQPGEVVQPNAVKCIVSEGFPIHRRPFEKGRLFIKFEVEFPKAGVSKPADIAALEKLLGQTRATPSYKADEVEEVELKEIDPSSAGADDRSRREAYDDEDDEPRQGQCAMGAQ